MIPSVPDVIYSFALSKASLRPFFTIKLSILAKTFISDDDENFFIILIFLQKFFIVSCFCLITFSDNEFIFSQLYLQLLSLIHLISLNS